MPAGLQRLYGHGHLHFMTFSCYQRLPLLKGAYARGVIVRELAQLRGRMGFLLIGYVVMPEHVHLLMSEPPSGTPSDVLHDLKLRTARLLRKNPGSQIEPGAPTLDPLRKELGSQIEPGAPTPRAFWQARFHDFNVFTEKKKREKLEYMHGNPVIRGLVSHPEDWPWSSWSNYAKKGQGLIPVDLL